MLTAGTWTVGENGSWSATVAWRQVLNGQTTTGTDGDAGSWTRAGTSVTFKNTAGSTYQGTLIDAGITIVDPSPSALTYLFAK